MKTRRHITSFLKTSIAVLSLGLTLLHPLAIVQADDLYQQEDIMAITAESGSILDEFFRPKADIIIDANTGDILYGDNIDVVRDSGSMAKLMSAYVVFRAIKDGTISYDTQITATEADQAISENPLLSNAPIQAGVSYPVKDLIKMLFVPSSSAAVIMLANAVTDNDPDKFLDLMNQYAQEIGMTKSRWNNPNGAPIDVLQGYYQPVRHDTSLNNEITARDMAILGYHIVQDVPELLNYSKESHTTVMEGTPYQASFDNYNMSLEGGVYELKGADGLKTGSSPSADYNYTLTAKRGKQRIIEVILGVGNYETESAEKLRHVIGNALAEKIFADYEYKKVLSAGQHQVDGQSIQLEKDFYATVKKGTKPKLKISKNRLTVDNGLQSVSPKIKQGVALSNHSNSTRQASTLDPMWIFCFLPAVILTVIFRKTDPRK